MTVLPVRPPPPTRVRVSPIRAGWGRISPSIVPILAVLTALLLTIPFMILTGGRGDAARGLTIAGTAYSALIEGSLGLVINDIVSVDNFDQIQTLSSSGGSIERGDLRRLSRAVAAVVAIGETNARAFNGALARFPNLDDEAIGDLANSVVDIERLGDDLEAMRPLIAELEAGDRGDVRALAEDAAAEETLTPEIRSRIETVAPSAADYNDTDLLRFMSIINTEGVVKLARILTSADLLAEAGLAPDAPEAQALIAVAELQNGAADAREAAETIAELDAAGVTDANALQEQIEFIRRLYDEALFTGEDVVQEINQNLNRVTAENLLVRRPGNRLDVARGSQIAGIIRSDGGTPEDPTDDLPETVYLRLGGAALLFFPANLEAMLVRSIPFVIAGLAVALGFKAGLFNIGAEGQLYAGAILTVAVGISPVFAGLPWFLYIPLVLIAGLIGGAIWGAIPGALKAYTGASEVIVTIMLNYIAIRLVDWLIKSTDPIILLDPAASTPRTPVVNASAILPRFDTIPVWLFIAVGLAFALFGLYRNRERIARDLRYAVAPVVRGVVIVLGGLFLSWITVRGALHIGFIVMILAVGFTDWFLIRTTAGFEIRTVGANPDAARYSGMSVARNVVLAMMLSGGLAGLAGSIEITGVALSMQPAFFSGVGFDAIAVALLARSAPRNMIPAGLLWGSLLAGAALMQLRANLSIDLVRIIQALIIMFIAADMIVRRLWRVPEPIDKRPTSGAALSPTTQPLSPVVTPVTASPSGD